MRKLASFQNRNTLSQSSDDAVGVNAARKWLEAEFRKTSPRLQVMVDTHAVQKHGELFFRDANVVNIVAVLPGVREPERQILVTAHYDSIHLVMTPGGDVDARKSAAEQFAPGASDDASGTAAVLELARILSQREFPATLVFIAFDAEEYLGVGSSLYARRAAREHQRIEAVLNNDIIGTETAGNGHSESSRVRLFSEEPSDSPSRELARYIKTVSERYIPSMSVDLIFRQDRFTRGGDHTSFNDQGFPAVRFTSAVENYGNQHSSRDTLDHASPAYTANVTRINAAALAMLASAPLAPEVVRRATGGPFKGVEIPNLTRGDSGYAALLRWKPAGLQTNLAGYNLLMRSTISPYWEREVFVGNVSEYLMEGVSIDDFAFGVQVVDTEGHLSLAAPYRTKSIPSAVIR
jgi:hypothetical protein